MAAKRRTPPESGGSPEVSDNQRDRIRVSFIGEEIDRASRAISAQSEQLPLAGRIAARVALTMLGQCKTRIRHLVDCDGWLIK